MTTAASPHRPSAFAVFRKRDFTMLWIGQFISTMGTALTSIAASILVYRVTGSALSVGLMLMATALPSLFVGLIAGVFVDRYDRKRIMIGCELMRSAVIILIPFLLPWSIAWLYIMVMLASAISQFYDPAHESVLPEVASDEELAAANSLMTISTVGSTTIGFAAAGFIASQFSIDWAFYLNALTFLVSALCITRLRIARIPLEDKTTVKVVFQNLRAGLRWVKETPPLRSLFLLYLPVFVLFGLHNSLLLPFSLHALNATEFEYSLLEGLFSVGFVLGSLLMVRLADRLHEGQWITLSLVGLGVVNIFFSLSSAVPLAIAIFVIGGLMNAPSYIGRQLLIQRNTAREIRGRVSSAFLVTRDVVFLVGMAAAGLADVLDIRSLFFATSVLVLGVGLLSLVMPNLRQPAAEWRRTVSLLRGAYSAPGLGLGRAATAADFDLLAMRLPSANTWSTKHRQALIREGRVYDAAPGTAIVRHGEQSDAAYFILDGRAVAGREQDGANRPLEVLNAGDFFGEIAALTGVPRTANVVADQPSTVLQVPAPALRQLMDDPAINRLFLSTMTQRMMQISMIDLPRVVALDQGALRELRTPPPESSIGTAENSAVIEPQPQAPSAAAEPPVLQAGAE